MNRKRVTVAVGLAASVIVVSASSAEARWYHRGGYYGHGGYYGGGPGIVGGAVIGALTVATLPFAIIGAAVGAHPRPTYDNGYGPSYGPPPPTAGYYGRGDYGPPPPPRGYYRNYGPPPGYYGGGY